MKSNFNQKKQGFSLIELGIVVAIIAILIAGLLVSSEVRNNIRRTKPYTQLIEVEKKINEHNSTNVNMKLGKGDFQTCIKDSVYKELNLKNNICRAMYCIDEASGNANARTSNPCTTSEYTPTRPHLYWTSEMLNASGYISTKPQIQIQNASGDYSSLTTVSNSAVYGGSITTSMMFLQPLNDNATNIRALTSSLGSWATYFPRINASIGYSIGYTIVNEAFGGSSMYGHMYTLLPRAHLSQKINQYTITMFNATDPWSALMTSIDMQKLDEKFDDGKPASGALIAGRPLTTSSLCVNSANNTIGCADSGNIVKSGPFFGIGLLDTTTPYACYNISNDTISFNPYTQINTTNNTALGDAGYLGGKDPYSEYTHSASYLFSQSNLNSGTPNNLTKTGNNIKYGCNMTYITSSRWD